MGLAITGDEGISYCQELDSGKTDKGKWLGTDSTQQHVLGAQC